MDPKKSNVYQPGSSAPPGTTPKTSRSYIRPETKAAAHPVRAQILKALREGEKSTVDLEKVTRETRYNLYHHLNALEQVGLIGWTMRDFKTKLYHAKTPATPGVAVIILTEDEVREKKEKFKSLIETLGALEGKDVPDADKITSAEICLYYSREEKE
jgi:DNA-binding transcriptional ArsR family regulator